MVIYFCKYCKKTDHNIDECKDIICKTCTKRGHPYWKCIVSNKFSSNYLENKCYEKKENNIIYKKNIIVNNISKNSFITILNEIDKYRELNWGDIC